MLHGQVVLFPPNNSLSGYRRLGLGVAPVVFAWSTLALDPTYALIAQWVGFTGMVRNLPSSDRQYILITEILWVF